MHTHASGPLRAGKSRKEKRALRANGVVIGHHSGGSERALENLKQLVAINTAVAIQIVRLERELQSLFQRASASITKVVRNLNVRDAPTTLRTGREQTSQTQSP